MKRNEDKMEYIKEPMAIEEGSMAIIESEMKCPERFSMDKLKIVKRVIHTTGDFEYEDLISFGNKPIEAMLEAIESGCKIYADTNMIAVGVNRRLLKFLGCEIVNYVHDIDVCEEAKKRGLTRSMIAMEKAFKDDSIKIYLIGNAPTALLRLLELAEEYNKKPSVIVGVPVGFVGAAESKVALMQSNHTYISIKGRKGGSPVAAAIMNAVLKMGVDQDGL
jgi:precorrin-8X/cobalt-precorrin-8 methylmutase